MVSRPSPARTGGSPPRRIACPSAAWLLASAAPAWAWAQTPPASDAAATVEPLVVTATRYATPATRAPASVSIISRPQIERRNAYRLGDALADTPGLVLRGSAYGDSFPASGAVAIAMRGIPRTARTLVLVDGHPLNNALSGAIDLSSIDLDDVDRIEVASGPFSAQYGGDAMGGVIQIFSAAPREQRFEIRAGAGGGDIQQHGVSFAWRDRLPGGLAWSLALGERWSEGWAGSDEVVVAPSPGGGAVSVTGAQPTTTPDNRVAYRVGTKGRRPWDQLNAGASLYYDLSAHTRVAVGLAHSRYSTRYSSPTTLLSDAAGQPMFSGRLAVGAGQGIVLAESDFLTPTPSSERDLRLFARLDHGAPGGAQAQAHLSYLEHTLTFPQPSATASYASGPGQFTDQPNNRLDVDLNGLVPLGEKVDVMAGASASRERLERTLADVAYWRDPDTRTAIDALSSGVTWNQAVYAQLTWTPADPVSVYLGLRHDRFETEGRAAQLAAPAFDRRFPRRSQGETSPKAAAVYRATPALTLRASYGEGFHAPTLLDLYTRSTTPASLAGQYVVTEPSPTLRPERVRAWELGGEWRSGARRLSLAYYEQTLVDLFYRQQINRLLNQVVNAGEAQVNGLEGSFDWPLGGSGLKLFGSATQLFRYAITKNPALPASVGKKIPEIPAFTAALGVEGDWGPWSAYVAARRVSHAFGSSDNLNLNTEQGVSGSWDQYTIADIKLTRRLNRTTSVSVSCDNALNANYYEFYRQPYRSLYFEIRQSFQ